MGPILERSFPFGAARMTALRALAPFLSDAATGFDAVIRAFKFDAERREAGDLLAAAARAGLPAGWGRTGLAEALSARLAPEHFDDGKIAAVTQVLGMGGWMPIPCAAVAPLLHAFPFGDARLTVLRALAPHISDIAAGQAVLIGEFKFDGTFTRARRPKRPTHPEIKTRREIPHPNTQLRLGGS